MRSLRRLKKRMTKKEKAKIAKRQKKANEQARANGQAEKCFYWTGVIIFFADFVAVDPIVFLSH